VVAEVAATGWQRHLPPNSGTKVYKVRQSVGGNSNRRMCGNNSIEGRVAQRITRLTTDQKIAGSNPAAFIDNFFFFFSFSKSYNFVFVSYKSLKIIRICFVGRLGQN
jgi:hypothetical protein